MESSVSTPHCSFVFYLRQDVASLNSFVQDFRAFFQKFPLQYELIGVIDTMTPELQKAFDDLRKTAPANESWQIIANEIKLGRARSLQKGLSAAKAEYLILPSLTLSTPLGDLFKILQHLMSESILQACWGERYSKKTEMMAQAVIPTLKLEHLHNKILREKISHLPADPLSEIGGMRKEAWLRIKESEYLKKKKAWYFTHACQHALVEKNMLQQGVYIHDSGVRPAEFSLWKARFELLRQSLFETV
jgi:hypothetical protein